MTETGAAAITVQPAYAEEVGIAPAIPAADLVGAVLNCGPYDPSMVAGQGGLGGWFVNTVAWACLGTKDFDDPLTPQGRAFATRLTELGVDVEPVFFPDDHEPKLGHEYQFDLDSKDGQDALESTVSFLKGGLG